MVFTRSKIASLAVLTVVFSVLVGGLGTPGNAASSPSKPVSPYGANDWTCKPTAARPNPVILVHGTYGDQQSLFDYLSWYVDATGYCVFAFDYGFYATNPIAQSAGELKVFVDRVLAATGAAKVSLIGHSQGGMMPRYYIKNLEGAEKVEDLIGIVPSNHGTTWTGLLNLVPGFVCRACQEQMADSPFLTALNEGDETPGSVSYTTIATTRDVIVTPYTSSFLSGPNTTNVRIQDVCPANVVDHIKAPMDPAIIRVAVNALETPGPGSPLFRPRCTW